MNSDDMTDDKLHSLLHYMSGTEPFSTVLAAMSRSWRQWCPFTHAKGKVNAECYHGNPSVQGLLAYIDKYALFCRYLDAHPFSVTDVQRIAQDLRVPERMRSPRDFQDLLNRLKEAVAFMEPDISRKLGRFTCLECQRLDEAVVCFQNYCFYSCVVMAVSAVEARVGAFVRRKRKRLFDRHFRRATFGQLIQVFDERHYTGAEFASLKRSMPDKHKPLVQLLNHYRVFSAHPKAEIVTSQAAEAILKLAFTYMIDPETCPYTARELKCK